MMYGDTGSTALQRTLNAYNAKKRNAKIESSTPTALSGIGMWNKMGEDALQQGLTDPMMGNMNVQNSASLGTSFGQQSSNPWEAFLATPAEQSQDRSQQGSIMQAYSPRARGVKFNLLG